MSQRRHHRLEELFHRALELPASQREAFLGEACADDSGLLAEIMRLLAHDNTPADPSFVAERSLPMPERIGPYRLVRALGEGGFAIVYLAEQDEPLRRQVALKILKPGLDTRATLARFEAERQALAAMNHDGIARIHDAGATEQGRPYFVMEYVPGETFTRYCHGRGLGLDERLALFAEVCDAVHHAQQKGVIHRDLKPSNVLVTENDGRPRIKVIDFGIAKATSPDLPGATLATLQGQTLGTPEYMSPEQAGLGPGDLDTRTDIYSLGVILYELLAGAPPFSPETLRKAGLVEIQRIIREDEPPRPSIRLRTRDGATRPSSRSLVKRLQTDLDWVVLKAMEKDRERRYASPAGLAADIRRYLAGEALVARPPSTAYRLAKLARRHRVALVVSAALILGLVGLSAGVSVALVESQRQRAATEAARDEAEAVTGFLVDMLGAAKPYESGRGVTVLEVLDSTVESLDEDLGERPLVATRVRRTLADTYTALGQPEAAESLAREAFLAHEELLGPHHAETLSSMDELADALMQLDRLDESIAILGELHQRTVAAMGEESFEAIDALHQRGNALANASRYDEAERDLLRSRDLARRALEPGEQASLAITSNLANFYAEIGRPAAAEPLLREVLIGRIALRGDDHPEVLEAYNNLGMVFADQGRFEEAIPHFRRAFELQSQLLGPGHREALVARNNLAAMDNIVFRWSQAESLYTEGVAVARAERDPGERIVHFLMNNLGDLQRRMGRFDLAREQLTEALNLRREHLGPRHRDTYSSLHNLGQVHLEQGELDRADSLLVANLAHRRELLGAEHRHTLASLTALGRLRHAQGDLHAAESTLAEAYTRSARVLGADHRNTLVAACYLGRTRLVLGEVAAVGAMHDTLLAVADSALVSCDPLRGAIRSQLARVRLVAGDTTAATALRQAAGELLPEELTRAVPWREDHLAMPRF